MDVLIFHRMVIDFNASKNFNQIKTLLNVVKTEFCANRDPNKKKGGLIAMASIAIGLGKDAEKYLNEIVFPVLNCCMDGDSKVRYSATESLYNVVKIARTSVLKVFPEIFSSLAKLSSDPDVTVKNGSELLDRLLKDVVTESYQKFDLNTFLPLIRERIYTKNHFARQFIISWISVLNAVPEINMVVHLPEILDGLFQMLDDTATEIQRMNETLLMQFLRNVRNDPNSADIPGMTNILIAHAQSTHELIQFTAITWLREFVTLSGPKMLKFSSGIFQAILPCLAYEDDARKHIRESAIAVNGALLELVTNKEEKVENLKNLNLNEVMNVLAQYLVNSSVNTKVAVLRWIHHLFTEIHDEMSEHANNLSPALLDVLSSDSSDDVVLESLIVLAEIVNSTKSKGEEVHRAQYRNFLINLLNCFKKEKTLLEKRGNLIIRQLCVLLNAQKIYQTFSEILQQEVTNLHFISTMVRTLNSILLTSPELYELRTCLKDTKNDETSSQLFICLYKSWAHCPVSTLALCILGHAYLHVSQLVGIFSEIEITVDLLEEVDKLVQLLESPIFATLRLTLVSHENQADAQYLAQALYGILMLLPQTEAFHLLKNRLQCVPNYWGQARLVENFIYFWSEVCTGLIFDVNFSEQIILIKKILKNVFRAAITYKFFMKSRRISQTTDYSAFQ